MSKRSSIIIIILVLIIGTGLMYFLLGGKAPNGVPILGGSPFGTAPNGSDNGNGNGSTDGDTNNGTGGSGNTLLDANGRPLASLFKISYAPIAGAVSILKNGSTYVRYVERATGHVIDVNPATLEKTQIWNTTRPHIYVASFKPDGSGFVERTVAQNSDTIANTSISLIKPAGTSTDGLYTARATLLRGNVGEIVVNTDGNLIYTLSDTGGILTSTFAGEQPKLILTMPFTEWRVYPKNSTSALLQTKASSAALGYAYNLNLSTGALTKLLGPLPSLTVLPSLDGKHLAYAYTQSSGAALSVKNLSNNVTTNIFPVTLPEKCVWSKKNSLLYCGVPDGGLGLDVPDLWYQGVTAYTDKIWRFNTDTETAEILIDPKGSFGQNIDVMNPILSPDEDYLFFTNKNDLSLWTLRLLP